MLKLCKKFTFLFEICLFKLCKGTKNFYEFNLQITIRFSKAFFWKEVKCKVNSFSLKWQSNRIDNLYLIKSCKIQTTTFFHLKILNYNSKNELNKNKTKKQKQFSTKTK